MNLRFPFSNHGIVSIDTLTATEFFARHASTDKEQPYRLPGAGAQIDCTAGVPIVLDFGDLPPELKNFKVTMSSSYSSASKPHDGAYFMTATVDKGGTSTLLGPGEYIYGITPGTIVTITPTYTGQICLQSQHS